MTVAHKPAAHKPVRKVRRVACPCCDYEFVLPDDERPRSHPQLKRYMAICRRVYEVWPDTHAVQFGDVYECRKWLEMKAGYRELVAKIPLFGIHKDKAQFIAQAALAAAMRQGKKGFAWPIAHGGELCVFVAKSVAYEAMTSSEFSKLIDKVFEVVRVEIGYEPDDYMRGLAA